MVPIIVCLIKYVEKQADMKTHEELPVVDKI